MSHIFISYARKDGDFVYPLADHLGRMYKIWIDREGIEPSDDFRVEIQQGIKTSAAFVVILSPDAVNSDYVNWEISQAKQQGIKIVPYMYRNAELPPSLARINYIKHDPDTPTTSFHRLLDFLKKTPGDTARIMGGKLLTAAVLEQANLTFEAAAAQTTGALRISVDNHTLVGLPVARSRTCTTYYTGFERDTLQPQPNLQLAIQLTGAYPDDDFPRGVAAHLGTDANLRMMLVRGPLSAPYAINEPATPHFYGLGAAYPDEWEDALDAVHQATMLIEHTTLQIFIKGPAVFLYRLGERRRDLKPTELFHFERGKGYYRVM